MSADTDMVERLDEVIDTLKTGGWVKLHAGALSYLEPIRAALDASGIGEMVEALEEAREKVVRFGFRNNVRQHWATELIAKIDAALRARATQETK